MSAGTETWESGSTSICASMAPSPPTDHPAAPRLFAQRLPWVPNGCFKTNSPKPSSGLPPHLLSPRPPHLRKTTATFQCLLSPRYTPAKPSKSCWHYLQKMTLSSPTPLPPSPGTSSSGWTTGQSPESPPSPTLTALLSSTVNTSVQAYSCHGSPLTQSKSQALTMASEAPHNHLSHHPRPAPRPG